MCLMARCLSSVVALFVGPVLCVGPASAQNLVLLGGEVWTGEAKNREAEAVVVVGGRIQFVGDSATARRRGPAGARRIDLLREGFS